MADNGNSVLDGLYLLAKSLPNKKNQAKAYLLEIIGAISSTATATWDTLTGKPAEFPPEDHTHLLVDITDYSPGSGSGDMTKAEYDTDDNGIVDEAEVITGQGDLATLDVVTESEITLADVTTNDVSTTKHGFVPKAPNSTSQWLRGDGTWAAIVLALTTLVSVSAGPSVINITDAIQTSITIT